jgi:hypothetical protein
VSIAEPTTESDMVGPVGVGLEGRIPGSNRIVRVWRLSDGGFAFEFEKDGTVTPLRLSQDAMNMVLEMHHRMTWMVCDVSAADHSEAAP